MSIATAITAAQGRVADCYTAISNKGGTLPATQNLTNMPTAINSIPGNKVKYGTTIDSYIGDLNAAGKLLKPSEVINNLTFTGVKDLDGFSLYGKFINDNNLKGTLSFPDLTDCSGTQPLYYTFAYCYYITAISFPNLKTVSGSQAMTYAFRQAEGITSVDFSSLKSVTNINGFAYVLYGLNKLETVTFPALDDLTGASCLQYCLAGCTKLSSVSFPALKTTSFGSSNNNQFAGLMGTTGTSVVHTIHFPSNLQSTIAGLSGYPLFGGSSGYVVLSFDLPATS